MITTLKNNELLIGLESIVPGSVMDVDLTCQLKGKTIFDPVKCTITYKHTEGSWKHRRDQARLLCGRCFNFHSFERKFVKISYAQSLYELSLSVMSGFDSSGVIDGKVYECNVGNYKQEMDDIRDKIESLTFISGSDIVDSLSNVNHAIISSMKPIETRQSSLVIHAKRKLMSNNLSYSVNDGICARFSTNASEWNLKNIYDFKYSSLQAKLACVIGNFTKNIAENQ